MYKVLFVYAGFPKTKWGNPSEPVRLALRVKLKDFIDLLCNWKRLRCRKWSYFSWKSHHVFFPSAILSLFTTSVCRLDGSTTGLIWSNSVWSAPHVYVNRGLSIALDFKDYTKTQHKPLYVKTFLGWDISGRRKMGENISDLWMWRIFLPGGHKEHLNSTYFWLKV